MKRMMESLSSSAAVVDSGPLREADPLTRQELEARRMVAVKLFKGGMPTPDVRRYLGVSRSAVSRWFRDWKAGGTLAKRDATGRPPRIARKDLAILWRRRQDWTLEQFAAAISREFSVRYHPDHLSKVIRRLRNG